MSKELKYGKDYKEHTLESAKQQLTQEGFEQDFFGEGEERTQHYEHRTLYWWINRSTTQRASISVERKNGKATVSYSMLAKQRAKPRTSEEIRRANYVQYD